MWVALRYAARGRCYRRNRPGKRKAKQRQRGGGFLGKADQAGLWVAVVPSSLVAAVTD